MNLRKWMFENDVSCTDLAKEIGCSVPTVGLLKRGVISKSLRCARKLEQFTKGEVTLEDLVNAASNKKGDSKNKNHEDSPAN